MDIPAGTATISLKEYEFFRKRDKQYWELLEEQNEMIELLDDIEQDSSLYNLSLRIRLDKLLTKHRELE